VLVFGDESPTSDRGADDGIPGLYPARRAPAVADAPAVVGKDFSPLAGGATTAAAPAASSALAMPDILALLGLA
jgi:hypothetical protein